MSRKLGASTVNTLRGESLGLEWLREAVAQSDLLPGEYGEYRQVVADSLVFFLSHLRPARLREILNEQSGLPLFAPLEERVVAMLRRVPTLHKLGQVLARDRRLSGEFRARLRSLESQPASWTAAQAGRILKRELPGWPPRGLRLGSKALAEGSVAVVFPFSWTGRPPVGEPAEGVFKVLKPGVEGQVTEELEIWSHLGRELEERCTHYGLPVLDYQETLEDVSQLVLEELRLERERAHLGSAASMYEGCASVWVPRVLSLCSDRVTALERIDGPVLSEALPGLGDEEREKLSRRLTEVVFGIPFFSENPRALMHGDPHAGNVILAPGGRLGMIDWSLSATLSRAERGACMRLLLGALAQNGGRVEDALRNLANNPGKPEAMHAAVQEALGQVRRGHFPGVAWLAWLVDQLVTRGKARFPARFLLFRKSLHTLEGVLADTLGVDAKEAGRALDHGLLGSFLGQFASEWPARWWKQLSSRDHGTHLSGHDLIEFFWTLPMTWTRYWSGTWIDLSKAATSSR